MLRSFLSELSQYLLAAPFPHLTTLKVSILAVISGCEARFIMDQPEFCWSALTWVVLTGLLAWGVVLCQADALSRYREFPGWGGVRPRLGCRPGVFPGGAAARAPRLAALLAASKAGCRAQARRVFRDLGYRWYHILPDAIVSTPLYFFHPRFLRSTFVPGKRP
jgi:hypothetical protein